MDKDTRLAMISILEVSQEANGAKHAFRAYCR